MKVLRFWVPVILWMAAIFFFSSRESVQVSDEFTINLLFFKTLHVLEYAMLFVLNYRAVKNTWSNMRIDKMYAAAFTLSIMYAITDEVHQTFVPTREGKLRDVIIDSIGATLSWILIVKYLPKAPKRLRSWAKSWHII